MSGGLLLGKRNTTRKKYNVEQGFVAKLIETKDMTLVKDQQIKQSFFSGDNRHVMTFIFNHYAEVGEVPTVRVIEQKFPHYNLETYNKEGLESVGTEESMNHWCAEMRSRAKFNTIGDITEDVVNHLSNLDGDKAFETLQQGIWKINNEIILSSAVTINNSAEARKALYKKRKENKGIIGIPYNMPRLDYITKGLPNGTLTTMIATTMTGKTQFECLLGAVCMLNNYKVLQLKTEMSTELMQDRYDMILFSMMYEPIDYNQFKSGTLSLEQELKYYQFLEEDLPHLEPLIIDHAIDVGYVEAKIQSENPDIILIDGVYLMNDQQGADQDWLRVAHITRDLKKLAERTNKPIFINSQADKSTSKKTGPELSNISFSQAIGQDSDTILCAWQDEIMRNDREIEIGVLKNREGMLGRVRMNWDFERMNFSEIYSTSLEGSSADNDKGEVKQKNVIGLD